MRRSATIKDVAERAGCGVATVSRVLNDTGSASVATREKVLAAASELGFQFSDIGRSLQSSTTKTIGCIVPSLANPVFAEAVQGVQAVLKADGYQLLLACSNYDVDEEIDATRLLLAKQVDGIILTVSDVSDSEALEMIELRDIPSCLMFNRPTPRFPSSGIDNYAAARSVAQAFHSKGHCHTGFLALRFNGSDRSRERFQGFSDGCKEFGMHTPSLLEIDEPSGDVSSALHDLLVSNTELTGIFASNDFLALAAIRAAKELGRHVPDDLSIVGFDGIEVGKMVEPSLATIATDARQMGSAAAQYVLRNLTLGQEDQTTKDNSDPSKGKAEDRLRLSFSFRPGASLDAPAGKPKDGAEAATSTPSRHTSPNPLPELRENDL